MRLLVKKARIDAQLVNKTSFDVPPDVSIGTEAARRGGGRAGDHDLGAEEAQPAPGGAGGT